MSNTNPRLHLRHRLQQWATNLFLAAVGLSLGVALAEAVVRWVAPQAVMLWRPGPFLQDGEGYFRMRPGYEGILTNRTEYENSMRFNAAGLRGARTGKAKAGSAEAGAPGDDVCRVLAIGDSFTLGIGVDENDVFHQLAADLQPKNSRAIEVLNGGIPAIGVPQAVRWLKRHGLENEPDVVLLSIFIGNDLRDAVSDYDQWTVIDGQIAPPGARPGLKDWLFTHSHLFALLKTAMPSGLQQGMRNLLGMGEPWSQRYAREVFMIYHRTSSSDELPPMVREGLERTEKALDDLVALADAHGFRVAATLIPDIVQVTASRWQAALTQLDLDGDDFDPRQPNRLLLEALAQRDIPALDFSQIFAKRIAAGDTLYYPIDRHWTAEGHRLAGTETATFLEPSLRDCSRLSSQYGNDHGDDEPQA